MTSLTIYTETGNNLFLVLFFAAFWILLYSRFIWAWIGTASVPSDYCFWLHRQGEKWDNNRGRPSLNESKPELKSATASGVSARGRFERHLLGSGINRVIDRFTPVSLSSSNSKERLTKR